MNAPPLFVLFTFCIAFIIGSIPTGYWVGRLWKGIDIRESGSGNLGATNVFRVLGWKAGILTLMIDIFKGWFCVRAFFANTSFLLHLIYGYPKMSYFTFLKNSPPAEFTNLAAIAGLGAIVGHTFSVFVKFRGGKGVATSAGVFAGLLPGPAAIALITFGLVFAFTKIVSMSSIAACIALMIASLFAPGTELVKIMAFFVPLLVIWKHRSNIDRLLKGTEPRTFLASRVKTHE